MTRWKPCCYRAAGSRLLPLHVERDWKVIDSLSRFDHVLGCLRIFLEMRRLQMRFERVGILVDFEQPNPCRIVLFENRTEPPTSWLNTDSSFPVFLDRGFELFKLNSINFELDHQYKLPLYCLRRCTLAWQKQQQGCGKDESAGSAIEHG